VPELEDDMTVNCARIGALMMQIQNDFLDTPALRLTVSQAHRRFGADPVLCEAVLGTLVDAKVLGRQADGAYVYHHHARQSVNAA
jgi:hypothetical protein